MKTIKLNLDSIFDIAGSDENAITKSFGVLLRKDNTLLNNFLSVAFDKTYSIKKHLFDSTHFYFENKHSEGRTDIEIINDEIHVIIESKIGTNTVKLKQANNYSEILNHSTPKIKCFIFLTEIGNLVIDKNLKLKFPNIVFSNISWATTLKLLKNRRFIKVDLVREYEKYLLEGRKMKIYDIDIWAVVVRNKQESNFDNHSFYINSKKHSPILIGKREWNVKMKKVIIKELFPVLKIHDPDSEKGKANGKKYVYDLGKKFVLEQPIIKKFSQASAISVKFDEI